MGQDRKWYIFLYCKRIKKDRDYFSSCGTYLIPYHKDLLTVESEKHENKYLFIYSNFEQVIELTILNWFLTIRLRVSYSNKIKFITLERFSILFMEDTIMKIHKEDGTQVNGYKIKDKISMKSIKNSFIEGYIPTEKMVGIGKRCQLFFCIFYTRKEKKTFILEINRKILQRLFRLEYRERKEGYKWAKLKSPEEFIEKLRFGGEEV